MPVLEHDESCTVIVVPAAHAISPEFWHCPPHCCAAAMSTAQDRRARATWFFDEGMEISNSRWRKTTREAVAERSSTAGGDGDEGVADAGPPRRVREQRQL